MWRERTKRVVAASLTVIVLAGCSDGVSIEDDPAVEPFVGDWEATALVLTSSVSDAVSVDLLELGATFTLNVQPSGLYTAILTVFGQSSTEIGDVEVSGQTVILNRTFPSASREISTYQFDGPDRVILDGDTEFDFNQDGTGDPALAHFELVRR